MCNIYISADPALYESRTRSLRIQGVVTTVRLENLFWDILREIASHEHMSTNQFVAKLYDELVALRGELSANFTSFLRVCCLRYLATRSLRDEVDECPVAVAGATPYGSRCLMAAPVPVPVPN